MVYEGTSQVRSPEGHCLCRFSVQESLLIAICKNELPGQEAVGDLHLDSFGPVKVKVHSFSGLSLEILAHHHG